MWYIEDNDAIIYRKCKKCNANFKIFHGQFSDRNSCRCHKWQTNGCCRDCGILGEGRTPDRYYAGQNCYHISQESLCIIL